LRTQHKLIDEWDDGLDERVVQPLTAMAAMNLDFLCIHPFRDGNRVRANSIQASPDKAQLRSTLARVPVQGLVELSAPRS
jgi:hypothetical protein